MRHFFRPRICAGLLSIMFIWSNQVAAEAIKIPEEYESTGGHSLAFGGSVSAGLGGVSAVRANPALLGLDREYSVNASYHWPVAGRDFYQVGVVDGKTSSVAAGVTFTGSLDQYQGISETKSGGSGGETTTLSKDSPTIRRGGLAFAFPVGKIFVGASGGYVEARPPAESLLESDSKPVKSFTLGLGAASQISRSIRIGFSAENLANKKIQYAAPTFFRAGASYFFADIATINLDYRRREAVSVYEGSTPAFALAKEGDSISANPENLVVGSAAVRVYDLLRLIGSVGREINGQKATTRLAGGVSLVNQQFNFSYQALRPNMSAEAIHHAVAFGLEIAM